MGKRSRINSGVRTNHNYPLPPIQERFNLGLEPVAGRTVARIHSDRENPEALYGYHRVTIVQFITPEIEGQMEKTMTGLISHFLTNDLGNNTKARKDLALEIAAARDRLTLSIKPPKSLR